MANKPEEQEVLLHLVNYLIMVVMQLVVVSTLSLLFRYLE
jgi:hypothetical protein